MYKLRDAMNICFCVVTIFLAKVEFADASYVKRNAPPSKALTHFVESSHPDSGTNGPALVDIVFVVDSSTNLAVEYFKCGLQALKDVAKVIDHQNPISEEGTKIGVARFATGVNIEMDIRQGRSLQSVINGLDAIKYSGGNSNTKGGINLARRMLGRGGRDGAYKMILLLTDGRYHVDPKNEVALLKRMGVEIYAVPVTDTVDMEEMRHIVSDPPDNHIITAVNYCTLDMEIIKILNSNES